MKNREKEQFRKDWYNDSFKNDDLEIKAIVPEDNKDNPVPSLDLEHYRKFLIKRGFTNNGPIMYAHLNPLKAYLKKYGVETNKEQPKKMPCKLDEDGSLEPCNLDECKDAGYCQY